MLYVASGVSRDKNLLECSVGRYWDKPRNIVSVPPKSGRLATMQPLLPALVLAINSERNEQRADSKH